jgi:ADP-heptose:LPS heptosyltransferase
MHILRTSSPIRYAGGTIQPGEWLCNDDNAFQLASMGERGSAELTPWKSTSEFKTMWSQNLDVSPKSILLIRSGAIGDLLLLTPAIRALRVKHPDAQIWLSCFKRHWDIFAQGDTHFVEYPLPTSELAQFDLIISLENVVELSTEKGQHATDAFAEALGVTVTDYRPVYRVTEEERAWWANRLGASKAPNQKRVALHLHASAQVRGYPLAQWVEVMKTLVARGWEIMLLGSMDGVKGVPPAIKDCSALSFREAAAVLSTCDVFCGVDSSFFNLCPALGVPAIGLFGPVDWRTRIKEWSGQRALHGEGCTPCGWTASRAGAKFPPMGPCFQKQQCVILEDIKPARVVSAIEGARR